jgi:hypothetical protein
MCKIILLDFVLLLNYKIGKPQQFERFILPSSSGANGERGEKTYVLGALDQV